MGRTLYDLHEPDDDPSPLDVSLVSETSFKYSLVSETSFKYMCLCTINVVIYLSMILFERYDFNPGYYSVRSPRHSPYKPLHRLFYFVQTEKNKTGHFQLIYRKLSILQILQCCRVGRPQRQQEILNLMMTSVSLVSETSFRYILCLCTINVVIYLSMKLFERYDFNF